MITPLVNREPRDAFLFTPQLSNNVRASLNKYAVLQQIRLNLDLAQSGELQRLLSAFAHNFALQRPPHRLAKV